MALLPHMHPGIPEAGCDEAGRGCLCGPVACAAVILPPDFECPGLDDSKKLSAAARETLRPVIEEQALAWAVVMVGPDEIDTLNILQASITGMHRALDALTLRPRHILVDGNRFRPYSPPDPEAPGDTDLRTTPVIPHTTVVKGDGKYMSIAAASVLAKTHRDRYMEQLALQYPQYGWDTNKGYPTRDHYDALRLHGPTPHHRMTFKLFKNT